MELLGRDWCPYKRHCFFFSVFHHREIRKEPPALAGTWSWHSQAEELEYMLLLKHIVHVVFNSTLRGFESEMWMGSAYLFDLMDSEHDSLIGRCTERALGEAGQWGCVLWRCVLPLSLLLFLCPHWCEVSSQQVSLTHPSTKVPCPHQRPRAGIETSKTPCSKRNLSSS